MSFDLGGLKRAIAAHGPVVRVVIAQAKGSVPRGAGTAMLIWADGQEGTIGGGALEYAATARARRMLTKGAATQSWSMPLGPALGQCCGGAVTLFAERFAEAPAAEAFPLARALSPEAGAPPEIDPDLQAIALQGPWLIEPMATPGHALWIWGAGHVGRALIEVFAPMPGLSLTWIDTGPDRFPKVVPDGVNTLPAAELAQAMPLAPTAAHHLILTYSHELDLALCHAALKHGFASCGLIGSATKWARFRKRLSALGHGVDEISRIMCPIGDPALGKHPQAIAIGVAAAQLKAWAARES